MRIQMSYGDFRKMFALIISVWSALVAFVTQVDTNHFFFFTFSLLPTIFLITCFYICYSSQKFRENIIQINRIATYIACFYDHRLSSTFAFGSESTWELSNMEARFGKEFDDKHQKVLPHMNGEYAFLCLASMVLTLITGGYAIYKIAMYYEELYKLYLYLVGFLAVLLTELALLLKTRKSASLKDFEAMRTDMFKEWKQFAQKRGYDKCSEIHIKL